MTGAERPIRSCGEIEAYLLSQRAPVHEARLLKYAFDFAQLPRTQELLFPFHFKLYHCLYQIKEDAGKRGLYLHMDSMRLRLAALPDGCSLYFADSGVFCGDAVSAGGRCAAHLSDINTAVPVWDPLRDFYSDIANINFYYSDIFRKSAKGCAVYCFRSGAVRDAISFFGFVSSNPGRALVLRRYRELARIYHPDAPGGNAEKMKQLNAHYDVLREVFPF